MKCATCGRLLNKGDVQYSRAEFSEKDDREGSWSCLDFLWGSKKGNIDAIAIQEDVPKHGIYQRRKTIQFDLESDGSHAKTKRLTPIIIRAKVGLQLY